MKSYTNTIFSLLLLGLVLAGTSCQRTGPVLVEPIKDLPGTWKLSKVLRNSGDITEWLDISSFRLRLQENNAYTIEGNNIPFVVDDNGEWTVDDPAYPYNLSFTPSGAGGATVTAAIGTTVISGKRALNVNFSPGCHSNQYVYVFEKEN